MQDAQDDDTTHRIAESALARMRRLGVPPTPRNYEIFYTYFAGTHPDLTQAVDILAQSGDPLTEAQTRDIYQRFFASEQHLPTLEQTSARLENAIAALLGTINQSATATNATGRRIADLSGNLAEAPSAADLQSTVRELLQETRAVVNRNRELEQQLKSSSSEVTELRRDLDAVRRDAVTDGLTGIANRKQFDSRIHELTARASDGELRVALVIADIDHFKVFNDRYGHDVGDEVLKLVARHLHQQVKGRDTAARFGGEEFALLLPETRLRDAATLADRIRGGLAGHELTSRTTRMRYGRVTLSAGIAEYRPGEQVETFVRRADRALYAAKHDGRNRVFTEDEVPGT